MQTPLNFKNGPVIVVMGVSGCGKSTIAKAIASRLALPFLEGDDFHPPANVEKMSKSIGLTDDDRWPWLDILGAAFKQKTLSNENEQVNKAGVVASCSSLKRSYRERLSQSAETHIMYVYLHGSRETLLSRMQSREDHFMPASLLDSQLETLEKPEDDEFSITISIENSIEDIVEEAMLIIQSHIHLN